LPAKKIKPEKNSFFNGLNPAVGGANLILSLVEHRGALENNLRL
jgi:hypothetical protein